MTLAMGAENAALARGGDAPVGLTYMTGALVRIGQGLAATLRGERPEAWLPYAALWLGLLVGAIAGAASYRRLGLDALWIASAWSALTAIAAWRLVARQAPRPLD